MNPPPWFILQLVLHRPLFSTDYLTWCSSSLGIHLRKKLRAHTKKKTFDWHVQQNREMSESSEAASAMNTKQKNEHVMQVVKLFMFWMLPIFWINFLCCCCNHSVFLITSIVFWCVKQYGACCEWVHSTFILKHKKVLFNYSFVLFHLQILNRGMLLSINIIRYQQLTF